MNDRLKKQFDEMDRLKEKEYLLNPKTRTAYIKWKRQQKNIEEEGRKLHRKLRGLG